TWKSRASSTALSAYSCIISPSVSCSMEALGYTPPESGKKCVVFKVFQRLRLLTLHISHFTFHIPSRREYFGSPPLFEVVADSQAVRHVLRLRHLMRETCR